MAPPESVTKEAIAVLLADYETALTPAAPELVAVLLEETLENYDVPQNWDRVSGFYFEAFEDVPPDLVALALKRQRLSPSRFFPKAGELRALIADELVGRRRERLLLTVAARQIDRRVPPVPESERIDPEAALAMLARATARLNRVPRLPAPERHRRRSGAEIDAELAALPKLPLPELAAPTRPEPPVFDQPLSRPGEAW
jgi:hypothetical protein